MKMNSYWWLAVVAVILIAIMFGTEWMKGSGGASAGPKSIVTTFAGDPTTSRAFAWYTNEAVEQSVVQLVQGAGDASFGGEDVITVQTESSVIEIEDGRTQGVHKAQATGLEPGTVYTYRVGSDGKGGWSEPMTFMTEAADTEEYTFINVADSQGVTEEDFELWGRTLDKAFSLFPDARFIIHNGDLTDDPTNEAGWDSFFEKASKWITSVPLMPVTGNNDEIDKDASRFTAHFLLPDNGAKGTIEGTNYSFDYGNAHYVVMDSESSVKKQAEWLRQDAESAAAAGRKWLIVAIHRPAYGGNQSDKVEDWIPVFDELGVDLVLQGHNHEYSRSYPLKDGEIVPDGEGTVYVTTNAAGQKFNEKKEDRFYHRVHFQNYKQMFAAIHVTDETLSYEAYDVDGTMLDAFTLTK